MNFDQAFDELIDGRGKEGGYANDRNDPGGETMWGVTARVARKHGYTGEMRFLPRMTAKAIARRSYWDVVKADEMPEQARYAIFDTAYNSSPRRAIELVQKVLFVEVDGILGVDTMNAIRRADPVLFAVHFMAERLAFLTDLANWPHHGKGWARRIAAVLRGIK